MLAAALALVAVGTFAQPTYVTSGPDGGLYVTEKAGMLREVGVADPVLDVSADVDSSQNERGLLSVAFAGGKTYLYFTAKAASAVSGTAGEIQVREFPGDRILISIPHTDNVNHNGGQLQIGPDGQLYMGTGDGGGSDDQYHHSQDPGSLLGKLIRIDPATGTHEVLSRGLRNPWRFSFAPDGQIVIADVGQSQREEIDVGLAANYGWPCKEGELNYRSDPGCDGIATAAPVFTRSHDDGACSITGGYVVTDPGLPSLLGRYVYGDYCAPALYSLDLANPSGNAAVGLDVPSLVSFGRDACGRIYTVSLAGPVSRLQEGAATACPPPVETPTPTPTPTATALPSPPAVVPTQPTSTADRRPCTLTARITGLHSLARRRFLSVALRADERCRATISARGYKVATAALEPGRRTVVRIRTAHAHRGRLAIRVQAVDAAGNVAHLTTRVTIAR